MIPTEHQEQVVLFNWARLNYRRLPCLRYMYAIPNGGWRHEYTAKKLKAEGVRPGVPDICLPVAKNGYFGLYIEMKRIKGSKVSISQDDFINYLIGASYYVKVCKGWDSARECIEDYLGGSNTICACN